jgi:hypothetical protein
MHTLSEQFIDTLWQFVLIVTVDERDILDMTASVQAVATIRIHRISLRSGIRRKFNTFNA